LIEKSDVFKKNIFYHTITKNMARGSKARLL
jgi:hypothetical protein